ncbi:very-long-chain 3-oxoacyl-coa reductase [Vairimorpha necatrix]|uniref:Very-long-chain 3-oxoacyl-coa reductase n=1 Tax=Vairimorpha necatrix TaxID=6039 RepID=A0AAX4JD94_9MICR
MLLHTFIKITSFIVLCAFIKFLIKYIWSILNNKSVWKKIENKTVVVTGALQEIGMEICRQLSYEKIKLLMIDSDREKLELLKRELEVRAEVSFYVVNFNQTADNYNIYSFLEDHDIGFLINAACSLDRGFETFINRRDDSIINTNILSTTHITHRVITQMVQRKCGYIAFIGESSFDLPVPFCALYSASLAYLHQLASSLYYELSDYGIVCEYVRYGSILKTRIDRKDGICHNNTKKFVESFLKTFGSSREIIPRFYHMLLHCIVFCIPQTIIGHLFTEIFGKKELEREYLERKRKHK